MFGGQYQTFRICVCKSTGHRVQSWISRPGAPRPGVSWPGAPRPGEPRSLKRNATNVFVSSAFFPKRPCVLAGMMLEGLRLDPSTPISCEHICLMLEGFKFTHSIVEGLLFNLFNQDVLEECRVHHFPNQPCVLACMMLEGFKFIHSVVEGLMFNPSNQDVLEECRFKLPIKTYR